MERAEIQVAVVEDDAAMRDSVVRLMRSEGLAAEPFATAEAFLSELPRRPPRCVLADLRLPGMSGIELLRAVMERRDASAHHHRTRRRSTGRCGRQGRRVQLIEKPFDPEALVAAAGARWISTPAAGRRGNSPARRAPGRSVRPASAR